jgi:hypothetical protein
MVKYCIAVHLPCTAEEYMVLKDDPEYVRYQLGVVGARELSRVSELGADGFVTQTIVNRPNIAVPRVLRPLLRGKEIEFRDVRRYRHGTQTTVPFEVDLEVFNSISDRVTQSARIRIKNVEIDRDGAVRETEDAEGREDASDAAESPSDRAVSDPFVSSPARVAERVALNAVGIKTCEIRCVGEVTIRVGPFSRRAEDLTVANMRRAYGRFPAIMAEWRRSARRDRPALGNERKSNDRRDRRADERRRGCETGLVRVGEKRKRRALVVAASETRRRRGELGGLDARRRRRRRRRRRMQKKKDPRVLRVPVAPRRAGEGGRSAFARQGATRDPRPGRARIQSRAGRDHRRAG